MQAVILAGGKGSRLGELTASTPKPLLAVAGRPFLAYLLWELKRFGFTDVVLLVGPHEQAFRRALGTDAGLGLKLSFIPEDTPAGTGGALQVARPLLASDFLLLNGDSWFQVNYLALRAGALAPGSLGCVALRQVDDVARYGRVTLDGDRICDFAEKAGGGPGVINAGLYWLKRDVLDWIDRCPASLEQDVLPAIARSGRLRGLAHEGSFIDIGTPESLVAGETVMGAAQNRPAAFLDRDGVVNEDIGYLHRPSDCRWVPGAIAAIRRLNDLGYLVVVVTNQAGVARGFYGEDDVHRLHAWMNDEIRADGAHIDAFYYCPHHPEGTIPAYCLVCGCRKPAPGMIRQALREWPIDPAASFLIGDKPSDIEAAGACGIDGHLYGGGPLDAYLARVLANRGGVAAGRPADQGARPRGEV